jgi:hypothetical protein
MAKAPEVDMMLNMKKFAFIFGRVLTIAALRTMGLRQLESL